MHDSEEDSATIYKVVINDEEQYSLWRDNRPCPNGWHEVGVSGPKAECLAHIERVWTDMSASQCQASHGR